MLYIPPPINYMDVAPLHEHSSVSADVFAREPGDGAVTFTGVPRDSVKVGRVTYPFRAQLAERMGPTFYSLEGFSPRIVGRGTNAEEARKDFERRLHALFQEVRGTVDFDRTAEQAQYAELFANLIDIAAYERTLTVSVKQIGQVVSLRRPGRVRVRWAGGATQLIDVEKAVADFARLKVGQWFEAVVRKRYLNDRLVAVDHVAPIRSPVHTRSERAAFWRDMENENNKPLW